MIQEVGPDHVLDNHFARLEPEGSDRVLHFRDGACLARASSVGATTTRHHRAYACRRLPRARELRGRGRC